jgi:type IV pilus assembly protein PilQ
MAGKQSGALVPITRIEPREIDGRTEIVVDGSEPLLQFTSYQVTEPLRLIVDITDADISNIQEKIIVGMGPVVDIVASQRDNSARLEIGLSQAADTKAYQAQGKLVIEISKPVEEAGISPEAGSPAPGAAGQTDPAAEVIPAADQAASPEKGTATIVSAVKATAGKKGVKVSIAANGTIVPSTFMVDGRKLVIDIPGARSKVRPSVIPVRKGGIDKVRVGQHGAPDRKVRVVLDLTRAMTYTATPEGNNLVIALISAASGTTSPQAAPQEKAAAVPVAQTEQTEVDQAAAEAPAAPAPPVAKPQPARLPNLANSALVIGGGRFAGRRISLDLQDADLINVLRLFADVANLNVILAPDVKGKVTVRMVNIPWDQAMDMILKMNGLGYALEDNVIRVASISALTKEAEEELKSKEAKKKAEDLITKILSVNYAKAKEVEPTLKKSLSARGETVVDERSNTIIVKDIARNVDDIVALVKILDKPNPQVMIESRIVEAITTFARDIGVQWGGKGSMDAAHGNPTGFSFPNSIGVTGGPSFPQTASGVGNYLVNLPANTGGSGGSIGFTFGSLSKAINLDLVLSALESTGEGKIISSPRVSALDNKEARVQQGLSIPYLSVSASGTAVQFIDAVLQLIVTPHVTPDNKIFMKIKATKNAPDDTIVVQGQPAIRKNEAETEILLADGETAVIGGILTLDRNEQESKVPFFGDIPFLGRLFKKRQSNETKRELIIFITPRIMKPEVI